MSQLQVTGEAKIRDIQGPVVANSGVITALDGAASQYVRGDGTLADFPTSSGGGSSVSYYLNSSVSQGTIGGVAYREFSKDPISGAGTDITATTNGYIASYITDANDPALLEVPAGNFNCEFYFSVNSDAHNPYVYAEIYKYDGSTFTLIGSSQSVPEYLTNGTTISPYYFAIPVTQTALTLTDRIAIRIYANVDTREVTLHTENNHLCQVVTTFSKGLTSLNNLTRQVQFLATGTSGTDFNIVSSGDTHTFNIPVASATNTGKLSSTDWSTFNNKVPYTGANANVDLGSFELNAILVKAITLEAKLNGTASGNLVLRTGTNGYGFGNNAFSLASSPDYDNTLLLISNKSAVTKTALFNINSLTADRTYTFPDVSGTIALLEGTQTFSGIKTFSTGIKAESGIFLKELSSSGRLTGYVGISATATGGMQQIQFLYPVSGSSVFSLPTTGAYNYEFPIVSGTIALTSDLSSYVPYTGATTNVNLGVYSLTANQLIAGGASTDNVATLTTYDQGHALKLKGSTGDLFFVPYFSPSIGARITAQNSAASANTPLSFYASNFYFNSNVNFGSTLGNGTYTYTLPSATGTLALTSNLSAYLPLTGGTLTGNLIINPSTTEYTLSVSTPSTNNTIKLLGSSAGNTSTIGYFSSNGATGYGALNFTPTNTRFEIVNSGSFSIYTSGIERFTVASGGTTTLTGALSGTSATFSGNSFLATSSGDVGVGTTTPNLTAANRKVLDINGTTESLISFSSGGTNKSYIYNDGTNLITQGATLKFQTGFTDRLTIAATGAATFSNDVTVNGILNNRGSSDNVTEQYYYRDGTYEFGVQKVAGRGTDLFFTGPDTNFNIAQRTSYGTLGGTVRFTVTSGGNVGIGTSAPGNYYSTKLVVAVGDEDGITIAGSGDNFLMFADGQTGLDRYRGFIHYSHDSNFLAFGSDGAERMRITSGGNVGIGLTNPARKLDVFSDAIKLGDTGSFTFEMNVGASSAYFTNFSIGGVNVLRLRGDGLISAIGIYNNTYSNAANVYIGSDGFIGRSTSSLKYKTDVVNYNKGLEDVMKLRAVSYKSKNPNEQGLTFAGLIAEEVNDLGLTEFVQYANDGSPDALSYSNMVALLIKAIQEQQAQIEELKELIKNK